MMRTEPMQPTSKRAKKAAAAAAGALRGVRAYAVTVPSQLPSSCCAQLTTRTVTKEGGGKARKGGKHASSGTRRCDDRGRGGRSGCRAAALTGAAPAARAARAAARCHATLGAPLASPPAAGALVTMDVRLLPGAARHRRSRSARPPSRPPAPATLMPGSQETGGCSSSCRRGLCRRKRTRRPQPMAWCAASLLAPSSSQQRLLDAACGSGGGVCGREGAGGAEGAPDGWEAAAAGAPG